MDNGNGNQPQQYPHPTAYGTPDASIVVFAGDKDSGRFATPLNKLTDGTPVIIAGMLTEVREHGTIDAPRATLVLTNDFGQAAYAAADTDTLAEYSMCLVDGLEVSLFGIARRPFQGDAELDDPRTNYVQITRVEPLFA
ncbi:hypothetical protein [Streptomyces sp. 030-HV]|uniref:hypothetical protein n=1 Tax=Streptomyces sp. 030-HV TaxID=2789262 RepID=UPI003980A18D